MTNLTGSGTGIGDVFVAAGAALGGTGFIDGDLTLAAGSFLAISPTSTLTVVGGLSLDSSFGIDSLRNLSGSMIDWTTFADGNYTLLAGEKLPTFSLTSLSNFGHSNPFDIGDGRQAYFDNGSLALTIIPEPSTTALLLAALAGIVAMTRRVIRSRAR